jgi:hypothetical protein
MSRCSSVHSTPTYCFEISQKQVEASNDSVFWTSELWLGPIFWTGLSLFTQRPRRSVLGHRTFVTAYL